MGDAMSQAILDAVHDALVADTSSGTLYDDLSGRIYQGIAPQNTTLPYLEFDCVSDVPERLMSGAITQQVDVQFDLYGNSDDGPRALGQIEAKLYALLEGVSIMPTGFDRGVVTCSLRMVRVREEDAYRITDQFTISGTEF